MGRGIRISDRQIAWWEAQPDAQTCRECGKQGSKAYVQPQYRGGGALCGDCINAINLRHREIRKAELAAMPRCEACGKGRGTWRVGTRGTVRALLCGRCFHKAKKVYDGNLGKLGGLALFLPGPVMSGGDVLELLKGGGE